MELAIWRKTGSFSLSLVWMFSVFLMSVLRYFSSILLSRVFMGLYQGVKKRLFWVPFTSWKEVSKWVKSLLVVGASYWQVVVLGKVKVKCWKKFVRVHCQYRFMKKLYFYYGISLKN